MRLLVSIPVHLAPHHAQNHTYTCAEMLGLRVLLQFASFSSWGHAYSTVLITVIPVTQAQTLAEHKARNDLGVLCTGQS